MTTPSRCAPLLAGLRDAVLAWERRAAPLAALAALAGRDAKIEEGGAVSNIKNRRTH